MSLISNDSITIELSIIIINWHSKNYLRQCLLSIFADDYRPELEIIVIDNASYDGCREMLAREFKKVRFIQSDRNLGFARANNLGFRKAKGRYLLFLNPDTEVRPGAIAAMLDTLKKKEKVGIVGARLYNSDGTIQTSCVQAFPNILNQILGAEWLRRRFPNSRLWGNAACFKDTNESSPVEAVSGACIMISRDIFQKVKGFSEAFFMYSEDIDISYRICQAGFINYHVPAAVVLHHGGGSSRKEFSKFSSIMMRESRYIFFKNTRGLIYSIFFRATIAASACLRLGLLFGCRLLPAYHKNWERRLRGTVNKWNAIFRWSIGLEKWVKHYPM